MGIESGGFHPEEEKPASLYRERASLDTELPEKARFLGDLEKGKVPEPALTPEGLVEIEQLEHQLGERLEKIQKMSVADVSIYPEYFLTEAGRPVYEKVFGEEPRSREEVAQRFFQSTEKLLDLPAKERNKVAGDSRIAARDAFIAAYAGSQNLEDVPNPSKIALILEPAKLQEKLSGYRSLRDELRTKSKEEVTSPDAKKARDALLRVYRRKVNELTAESFEQVAMIAAKRDAVGDAALSDAEKSVLEMTGVVGTKDWQRSLDRYDKFAHGATSEYREFVDEEGKTLRERIQVPQELLQEADRVTQAQRADFESMRISHPLTERGIDVNKIAEKKIDAEKLAGWMRELLHHYDLESAEDYDEANPTKLPQDNKWRVHISSRHGVLTVEKKSHTVFVPSTSNREITEALPVAGHEFMHVLQAENQQMLSGDKEIALLRFSAPDRSSIISEGGAMELQGELKEDIFGMKPFPATTLIRGMARRLEGGTFRDVFAAMDQDGRALLDMQRDAGVFPEKEYDNMLRKKRQDIFTRALRYFGGPLPLDSTEHYLYSSRATVYLEQVLYRKRLQESGVNWLGDVAMNPEGVRDLFEAGLLRPQFDKIKRLDFQHIRDIWEREKGPYLKE